MGSQYLAAAGSLTLHGDDFMTARSFTVMPRVSPKNPVALLIVILAQAMYGNVEFIIDESQGGIVDCAGMLWSSMDVLCQKK